MNPLVSVIMPVRNARDYVSEAILSILRQTETEFECIIVDDRSDDGSSEVIASFSDTRIIVVQNAGSPGITGALNTGLQKAHGSFIARMDADDISEPRRFERQCAALRDDPSVAVVGSNTILIDASGEIKGKEDYPLTPEAIRRSIFVHNPFAHSAIMMRASVLAEVGTYDEAFVHNEDYDLWLRIGARYDLMNIADRLLRRRVHGENITVRKKRELTGQRVRTLSHAVRSYYHNPLLYAHLVRPATAYALRSFISVFKAG